MFFIFSLLFVFVCRNMLFLYRYSFDILVFQLQCVFPHFFFSHFCSFLLFNIVSFDLFHRFYNSHIYTQVQIEFKNKKIQNTAAGCKATNKQRIEYAKWMQSSLTIYLCVYILYFSCHCFLQCIQHFVVSFHCHSFYCMNSIRLLSTYKFSLDSLLVSFVPFFLFFLFFFFRFVQRAFIRLLCITFNCESLLVNT